MKTVTSIDDFVLSLNELDREKGNWIVYPKIAGYETNISVVNGIATIEGKEYDITDYLNKRQLPLNSVESPCVIAPKVDTKWINVDNLLNVDKMVKSQIYTDFSKIIDDCYFLTLSYESNLRHIPYHNTYDTLYDVLDHLNFLDRNLRTGDWYTIGLLISRGGKSILYIKPPLEAITTIREITYNVGRTGVIIPIAKFEPVNFNGTLTLQATLHNSKTLSNNIIGPNDIVTIRIKRQGHQSTELTSVVYPYKKRNRVKKLSKCPSCNSNLVVKKKSDILICVNSLCREKLIKKVIHWCSAEGVNIKGLGISYIIHLIDLKIITTIDDLYVLTKEDLLKVPGILDKMADNILSKIEQSKKRNLIDVFVGLGIDGIGRSASKFLAWHLMSVYNLLILKPKEIKRLSPFITDEQKDSLIYYLKDEMNREVLLNLSRHLNPTLPEIKTASHFYYNKKFILKNTFPLFGRDKVKRLLTRAGIKILPVDSKDYDYCLYNGGNRNINGIEKSKGLKMSKLLLELIH